MGRYTAVEFFFIVTGYTAKQSVRVIQKPANPGKEAVRLTISKFSKLWPITTLSIVLLFLLDLLITPHSAMLCIKQIILLPFDIFYLPMSGLRDNFYNVPLWYLSALLLVLPLIYYCLIKYDDFISCILAPLVVVSVWGYYSMTYEALELWDKWNGVIFLGIFRALAGVCGGIVSYQICSWIVAKKIKSKLDFIKAFLLLIGVACTFSEQGCLFRCLNKRIFKKCGIFGFVLYATHWIVRTLLPFLLPDLGYYKLLPLYITVSLSFAFLIYTVFERYKKKRNFKWNVVLLLIVITIPGFIIRNITNFKTHTKILGLQEWAETGNDGLTLTWTNSGIEFEFYGTAVYVDMMAIGDDNESSEEVQALTGIFIDENSVHNIVNVVDSSMKRYVAVSGLKPGKHRIRILKLSEARDSRIFIKSMTVIGTGVKPTALKEKSIEFIGDSNIFFKTYSKTMHELEDGIRSGHPSYSAHQMYAVETIENIRKNVKYNKRKLQND